MEGRLQLKHLALMFTERCNARCRHCGVRDHMPEGQDMPLEDVFRYIDELAALSIEEHLFAISISGGEPFLRYPDLLAVTRYAREKGATQVSCVTNGFWGKDPAMARQWATELSNADMHHICFSLGDFHREYIPLDWVRAAVTACREAQLRFGIKCVVTRRTRRLPDVLRDLGNLLLDVDVSIQELAYVPESRAGNIIPKDEWLLQEGIPQGPCPGLMLLAILPDGTTFPCCGLGWTQRLVVGNARSESIADLMHRARDKSLFAALRDKGPAFFVPYFTEAGCPLPEEGYVNHCHLCKAVLEHPNAEPILPIALADWKIEQVEKRLRGLWKPEAADYAKWRALAKKGGHG